MKTIFRVSDLDFIDSETEQLSFIPNPSITNKFSDKDLLRRIFTENISVEPEPEPAPVYPEVIQKLIDGDAQNTADVAKILNLYNPADISNILKKLIDTDPQPTDRDGILNNNVVKGYPYELFSAIYDYTYSTTWTKIGSGTITRDGDNYIFNNAGVQHQNIITDMLADDIYISTKIKILKAPPASVPLLRLYNTLSTTENLYPFIGVTFSSSKKFTMTRRQTTNGDLEYATEINTVYHEPGKTVTINFAVRSNGTETYLTQTSPTKELLEFSKKTTIKPKHIRVMAGTNTTVTYDSDSIEIQQLTISDGYNNILSKWHK